MRTARQIRLGSTYVGYDSLGFWYRLTQSLTIIVVLVYTIGYSIMYLEAYKEFDTITSDVRGSLVGALTTNFTLEELDHVNKTDLSFYNRFWDLTKSDDFGPYMERSFFVPTNVLITTNQKRGTCPDYPQTKGRGKKFSLFRTYTKKGWRVRSKPK